MYRLLIVDDEPDIVEGLYNAFYNYEGLELDVFKSYSGYEAINILNSERIDIVLSDISMPGMDGLEMISLVKERWPLCQVIFLTGYTEFGYLYRANRLDAVDYILKTEGYGRIAESLHKAAERIRAAAEQNKPKGYGMQFKHEFISTMLGDTGTGSEDLYHVFKNMDIPFDPDKPVFVMVGRLTDAEIRNAREKSEVYHQISRLSDNYIMPHYKLIMDEYEKNTMIFVMQPQTGNCSSDPDGRQQLDPVVQIKGIAEIMQNSLQENSAAGISFAVYHKPVYFHELGSCWDVIRRLLSGYEASGIGLFIADENMLSSANNGEKAYNIGEVQAVSFVKEYIKAHLGEQLSLTLLANLVHYNSSYLSRIFKKNTGENLISYISDIRIQKAKEYLLETNMKISNISDELGFASQSYFNQAFRKNTGLSPAEFRFRYGKQS